MNQHDRAKRVGTAAILCAVLLRLWSAGIPGRLADFLTTPNIAAFLIYLETGRDVRFSPSLEGFSPHFAESPPPSPPEVTEPPLPAFSGEESAELYNAAGVSPDISALLDTASNNRAGAVSDHFVPNKVVLEKYRSTGYFR